MTEIELSSVKAGQFPDGPIKVTEANFEEFKKRFPLAVLDFWAPWCGPCKMMLPVVDELAKDLKGKVAFGKLNTDESPNIARKYKVQAIPTLLIFKGGEVVDQVVGVMPKKKLDSKLKEFL
jgi:thioredoxin 1